MLLLRAQSIKACLAVKGNYNYFNFNISQRILSWTGFPSDLVADMSNEILLQPTDSALLSNSHHLGSYSYNGKCNKTYIDISS